MTWFDPSRAARRLVLWAMTACLAVGLPLQSISALAADLLGARHAHGPVASAAPAGGPMDGWKDFRRANYDLSISDAPLLHAQAHELGLRHHHDRYDPSVVDVEIPSEDEGAPSSAPAAGATFVAASASGLAPHRAATEPVAGAWRRAPAASFDSQYRRRIERPPQGRG